MPYVKKVAPPTHFCSPPNRGRRRKDNVTVGTVWRCPDCGTDWTLIDIGWSHRDEVWRTPGETVA